MDRELEVLHLNQADLHIEKAENIIDRQLGVIEELERNGHDSRDAKLQLRTFEDVLATMVQHRRIIVQRIDDIDAGRG